MKKIVIAAYLAFVSASSYLYSAEALRQEEKRLAFWQSAYLTSEGTNLFIAISSENAIEIPAYLTAESGSMNTSLFSVIAEKAKLNDYTPISHDQYFDSEIRNDVLRLYMHTSPLQYRGLGAMILSYLPNLTSAFYSTDKNKFRASLNEILSLKYLERFMQGKLILHIYSGHNLITDQEPRIIRWSK
jgi:hypothetical protein